MKSRSEQIKRARPLLGTLVEISIEADANAEASVAGAFAAIARVHALMSSQEGNSDVSRINRLCPGECLEIDEWTYKVLARAIDIHKMTDGLFDCTASAVPSSEPEASGSERPSTADIELLPGNFLRVHRRARITLDGIAKGFAVDIAVESLVGAGIASGVVNAGGDLRIFGGRSEPVFVRVPNAPGRFSRIGPFSDRAVASSGDYFGNSSLINPITGKRVGYSHAMTVVAGDCMTADALTKPCLLSPERSRKFAESFGATAVFTAPAGNN